MTFFRKLLDALNMDNWKSANEDVEESLFPETESEDFKQAATELENAMLEFGNEYVNFINKLFSVHSVLENISLARKDIMEIIVYFDIPEEAIYVVDREAYLNQKFCSAHELKMLTDNYVSIITMIDGTWGIKTSSINNKKAEDMSSEKALHRKELDLERFAATCNTYVVRQERKAQQDEILKKNLKKHLTLI